MATNQRKLPSGWMEAKSGDGTPYYHNTISGVTQWELPVNNTQDKDTLLLQAVETSDIKEVKDLIKSIDELELASVKIAYEVAVEKGNAIIKKFVGNALKQLEEKQPSLSSGWEECSSKEGKPYYHNTITGETQWEHPADDDNKAQSTKIMKPEMDIDKDVLLMEAVDASDLRSVTQLVKCIDELTPNTVEVAHQLAQDKGNKAIIMLLGSAFNTIHRKVGLPIEPLTQQSPRQSETQEQRSLPPCPSTPETDSNQGDLSEDGYKYLGRNDCAQMRRGHMDRANIYKSVFVDEADEIKNNLNIKKIKFHTIYSDDKNLIRRLAIGNRNHKPTKTILLVGATGAGKTSLVNSLVNIAYGIKFDDNFRIKIKEEESLRKTSDQSQTEWITIYEFNHNPNMSIDYNLNVIDTPGLNDTRGLDYDKLMIERIEKVFREKKFDVDELNSIGIVTMASATRLTEAQKYIYEGCMRIFGKNVQVILHIMATFADPGKPPIEDGLRIAKVDYVKLHKFNNSSLFLDNDPKIQFAHMNAMYWDFLEKACGDFLALVDSANGQSLIQTIETLERRKIIHDKLNNCEQSFLKTFKIVLRNIDENIDEKDVKEAVASTEQAFNCRKCFKTCHKPCFYWSLFYTCKTCTEMSQKGSRCKVCGCRYSDHKSRYQTISNPILKNIPEEDKEKLKKNLREIKISLDTLKKVALRETPLSTENYLSHLIDINNDSNNDNSDAVKKAILEGIKQEEENLQILHHGEKANKLFGLADEVDMQKGESEERCCVS